MNSLTHPESALLPPGIATSQPSHNFQLGSIVLSAPLAQAALSGYSDGPMRVLARRFGAVYTLAEVVIDRFLVEGQSAKFLRRHLLLADSDHPIGGQLMGADPEQFQRAARRLVEAGFDVIDINFGCPVKSALGGCRGGYHLSQPEAAIEIVSRVRDTVPADIPVTVKMRRGIDDSLESREKSLSILEGVFDRGAAAVTLHGRTVEQKYVGPSRWSFLREVKLANPGWTILGSGDLFSAVDCVRMISETGVNAVSIARGAIGNPWIFSCASALLRGEPHPAPPRLIEQREVIEEHIDRARVSYEDDGAVANLRKHLVKYARLHPSHAEVRNAFAACRHISEILDTLKIHYSSHEPGVWPSDG